MTKKQTQATWTGVAIGVGIAAVLAWPVLGSLMAYYKGDATKKAGLKTVFDEIAVSV